MSDDRLYIDHALRCLARIARYTGGDRRAFLTDELVQDATLRNLQTLAEATQRLSAPCRSAAPEIDWRGISGFRNVLVHNYLGLDLEQVWDVIAYDLPALQTALERLRPHF